MRAAPPLRHLGRLLAVACLVGLAACSSSTPPKSSGRGPADQIGTYKVGKPYQINGVWYYPKEDWSYRERGIASWYGPGFHGKRTANGEIYDENDMTAAHPTLPMPVMVQVTNLENGRSLKVRINDRGPFHNGRVIDLSRRSAQLLGIEKQGTAKVLVEILPEESMQLVAVARGHTPDGTEVPSAAPVGKVETKPLGSGAAVTPAPAPAPPPQPQPQPRVTTVPMPTGVVEQRQPILTQIYVQAGSFVNPGNAETLRSRLAAFGRAFVVPARIGTQDYYRVRVGPLASVDEADYVLDRLIAAGHTESRMVVD